MKNSKRRKNSAAAALVALLFLVGAASLSAQGTETQGTDTLRFTVAVTWDLGLRIGIEYRPFRYVGFAADIGSTLFSLEGAFLMTGDVFTVFYLFPRENSFQLSARVGIPDWRVIFIKPAQGEVAFGASVDGEYQFSQKLGGFIRLGGGVPFFWDGESFAYRKVSFPLGLWPDLSLGARFRP